MELDRRELKRQARERMALTDPKFWVVALAYLAMTTGVSWVFSMIPIPDGGDSLLDPQLFLELLLNLYTTVVDFGLCLWALWTYRQLDPGIGSLTQGFSVAGRVILMELGIFVRIFGWYLLFALGMSVPLFILWSGTTSPAVATVALLVFIAGLIAILIVLNLRYTLAPYLLADRPDDGSSIPIYRSAALMRGWKMDLFKLELSFLGWELINLLLSGGVILFFLRQAGLLSPGVTLDTSWVAACSNVVYSMPVVILSSLVAIPVSMWLLPYRATARAGFYNARLLAASQEGRPEMPPL